MPEKNAGRKQPPNINPAVSAPVFCNCTGQCAHTMPHSYADHYKKALDTLKPKLVFEWGPGLNTKLAIKAGARVVAIEQDPYYVPKNLSPDDFTCHVIPVDDERYTSLLGVRDADVYFVDSRRRRECILSVCNDAKRDAVLFLHDAQRMRYHDALMRFEFVKFFQSGFCAASHEPLKI